MLKAVNRSIFLSVFVLVLFLAIRSTQADVYESVDDPKAKAFGNRVCTNPECTIVAANFINHGNDKIKPCDNFAQFTCDRYQLFKKYIPLMESQRVINGRLKLLLETPTSPEDKPYHTLMKTFYDKCMKQHEESPMPSFKALIDEIGGWPLLKPQTWTEFGGSFEEYIANIQKKIEAPILFNVLTTSNSLRGNKDDYMLHLSPAAAIEVGASKFPRLATLLGADNPSLAADINEFFVQIDNKRQELLDNSKNGFPAWSKLDVMKVEFPNFDLEKYVRHLFDGIAEVNSETIIYFTNLEYFQGIHTLLTDKRVFANYAVGVLASTFFKPKSICIEKTGELFEYPLSQLYVKNYFDHAAVPRVAEMFKLLKEELHEIIEKADWLDDTTRSNAFKKLDHLKADIGYPENLFDDAFVSNVYNIPPSQPSESYFALEARIQRRLHVVTLARISKKLDRATWIKTTSVIGVNAHSMSFLNKIYIPAAILILPHFSPNLPDYINFAATGLVVAHEITHGYDNKGRLYDETGDYRDWWQKETVKVYKEKSNCFVKQYDKENYDGQLSLGENIADNGGMKLAFNAYKKLMASRGGVPEPALPGFEEFTPEEMFFMAFASTWCNDGNEMLDPNDEHPPGETRLKVVTQNIKEFSETFACPKNAPMNPDLRCSLW
uniref:Neprilysin n=1 Tax=Panagrellus redivivus TaxID=6233 RepID=A0A7E4URH5_PANRE